MLPYKISIDNLTLIGYPTGNTLNVLEHSPLCEKMWTTPGQRYHYNISLYNGGFIQLKHETEWNGGPKLDYDENGEVMKKKVPIWGPKLQPGHRDTEKVIIGFEEVTPKATAGKPMRVEFNPNKYRSTGGSEKHLLTIIKTMTDIHLSRKDIAIDVFDCDLNDYNILDGRGRKIIEYKDSNRRLETLYFGSRESEEQLRIYDKAKEQKTEDGRLWWRIEGQMRGDSAKEMYTNPFRKVRIVKKSDYKNLPIKDRALLLLLQADPDSMKELSKNTRTKFKRMLEEDVTEVSILPDKMFLEHMEDIVGDINSWVTFTKPWEGAGTEREWNPQKDYAKSVLKEGNGDPGDEMKKEVLEDIRKWVSGA
jgi:hypothetical protein